MAATATAFLAFSEIHPDYYQIPFADRQALLEAEAAEHDEDEDEQPREPRRERENNRGRNRNDRSRNRGPQDVEASNGDNSGNDLRSQGRRKPSLQTAFVNYAGTARLISRPSRKWQSDYYQIPVADRQALMQEQVQAEAHEDQDHKPRHRRHVAMKTMTMMAKARTMATSKSRK